MTRPILGFFLVSLGLMTINAIYLYWTQHRYSCGPSVAAASISGIPARTIVSPHVKDRSEKTPSSGDYSRATP
jgi:hypothetical protein